jgi:methylated-DNA-[protein]-cysteine S-methyltransferase
MTASFDAVAAQTILSDARSPRDSEERLETMKSTYWDRIEVADWSVTVSVDSSGRLLELSFESADPQGENSPDRCTRVREQLLEYFAGTRKDFNLRLAPAGTDFQQQVWCGLRTIPYGTAWGYGDLARHIGKPGAARAVGQANGANPIPIVIPCHRIIAANGTIGGFSCGIPIKRQLLALERIELAA